MVCNSRQLAALNDIHAGCTLWCASPEFVAKGMEMLANTTLEESAAAYTKGDLLLALEKVSKIERWGPQSLSAVDVLPVSD